MFYITFGQGQYAGALANSYVEIDTDDEIAARRLASDAFSGKWSGIYSEAEFEPQPRKFGLMRLVRFDVHGNVLQRGPTVDDLEHHARRLAGVS